MSDLNDFQIAENFNLQEFECTHPTHSHVKVNRKLVEKLQSLRDKLKRPVIIISGYRCDLRNKQVGGADQSEHLHGNAADISLTNQEYDISKIAGFAIEIGFTGIGYYNDAIHLDVRSIPAFSANDIIVWDRRGLN